MQLNPKKDKRIEKYSRIQVVKVTDKRNIGNKRCS
jgi:hypothetical protein